MASTKSSTCCAIGLHTADRKRVEVSETHVERLGAAAWQRWRADSPVEELPHSKHGRHNVDFHENQGALVKKFDCIAADVPVTVAHSHLLPLKNGRLLCLWGQGGWETLIWSRRPRPVRHPIVGFIGPAGGRLGDRRIQAAVTEGG